MFELVAFERIDVHAERQLLDQCPVAPGDVVVFIGEPVERLRI